jgi:hypothetical protein
MKIYKAIWKVIGGRPWTYILRDIWHKYELFWILILISTGVYLGHHYDWLAVLKIIGVFALGYLGGHLFWGKEYIPDQNEEE